MASKIVLAFLLGVLCTLGVQRWVALERAAYTSDMRLSYIEGYLQQVSGGGR